MKYVDLDSVAEEGVSHNPMIRKKTLLRDGDFPPLITLAQAYFPPGKSAAVHRHPDMVEVFLVEQGRGMMQVEGRKYPLAPGVCVAVAPGEGHQVENPGPGELVLTYFGVCSRPDQA